MRKTILFVSVIALATLGLWLWRVMPNQAWAIWDQDALGWRVVAAGWETLLRGWPLALLGAIGGGGIALAVLGWLLRNAVDADHQRQIERLQSERDAARAATEAARADAEAALADDRAEVERLRTEALRAREAGHEAQIRARREVEAAQAQAVKASENQMETARRAKNAIMTLRRKTGEIPPSYRAKRTKSVP